MNPLESRPRRIAQRLISKRERKKSRETRRPVFVLHDSSTLFNLPQPTHLPRDVTHPALVLEVLSRLLRGHFQNTSVKENNLRST